MEILGFHVITVSDVLFFSVLLVKVFIWNMSAVLDWAPAELADHSGVCYHCCIYSKAFYIVISIWETCLDMYLNKNFSLENFQISLEI